MEGVDEGYLACVSVGKEDVNVFEDLEYELVLTGKILNGSTHPYLEKEGRVKTSRAAKKFYHLEGKTTAQVIKGSCSGFHQV